MKVIHLITGLEIGGAQTMLYKLLTDVQNIELEYIVVTLMDKGKLGKSIEALGVPVYEIGMYRGRISLSAFWSLGKLLKQLQPNIIQAWTYHGNIAASFVGKYVPHSQVIWNIRHTPYSLSNYKRLTYLLVRYGAWFSGFPAAVIYNSNESAKRHRELCYHPRREVIIPNGFDIKKFKPSNKDRVNLRGMLGLQPDTLLIGMVARYHPMKDHANFIRAATILHSKQPDVHFLLIGNQMNPDNQELVSQVRQVSLTPNVHLMGERSDIHNINAGLDIATLTSAWGDAFPNVIGEAMSCGVPCVVTDIGDSALIVGDTGIVVPPKDSIALAGAWSQLIELGAEKRQKLGLKAHRRIEENYSLPSIVRQYESLYKKILV